MLVSAEIEAGGYKAKTENMEIRFEEKTMFASGKVSAFGFKPTLTLEMEVETEAG